MKLPQVRREDLPADLDWLLRPLPPAEDDDDGDLLIVISSALTDDEAHAAKKEAIRAYSRDRLRRRGGILALPLRGLDTAKEKRSAAAAAVAVVAVCVIAAGVFLPRSHDTSEQQAMPSAPRPRASSSAPSHQPPSKPSRPSPGRPGGPPTATPSFPTVPVTRPTTSRRPHPHKTHHRRPPKHGHAPPHPTRPGSPPTSLPCGLHLDLVIIHLDLGDTLRSLGVLCPRNR